MAKTSIDGLTVRSSSPAARNLRATSGSRRVVGGILVDSQQRSTDIVRPVRRSNSPKKAKDDDFLSPVGGFNFDQADNDLGTEDESDWSSLLDEMEGRKEDQKAKTDVAESEPQKTRKNKKAKKPKKKWGPKRIIPLIILFILLGGGAALFFWGDSLISRLTNGNSGFWDAVSSLVSQEVPFETDANGRTNVLVFGTEGYDMDGTVGNTVHAGSTLTDSIMVISFDQKTKDVALLSLPRDLKVSRACSAGKVNEVFWCNNQDGLSEAAGAQALMEQVGEVFGLDFQYWAHVNWGSLIDIIDTVGGITVTLDEDINDRGYTGIVMKAGVPTEINGAQALGIARARHGTRGGDFTRGNSQQKIVEGIAQKLLDNKVGLSEILGLVNILGDNLRSNFSTDNIKAGVHLLSGFDIANIRNVPLVDYDSNIYHVKTAEINGISYVVPAAGAGNYTQIHQYIDQMFSSNPAVREGAEVAVYNATEELGVAAAEQERLEAEGYTVSIVGDAAAGSCGTRYCVFALNETMPATRAALEVRYGITVQSANELPQGVPMNADFVVIIGQTE